VAPSRTGKGAHSQGIANNAHANAVETKAENAAPQTLAKELQAMRAHKGKAQRETDATYAGPLCKYAFDGLANRIRSGWRAF
jgi:hypothetical protein